ncbi:MAG: ABC transporter ATP-binding protein [Hyphomicrobiales bacterium]|nr:ABC transporter ATP-binding protein [Hyphomicrobiales bacterium]
MSLLRIEHLSKSFGGVKAVNDVSFALAPGEMRAMIGPNGAGKTTLFNMVDGQLRPDAGNILLNGKSILGLPPRAIFRADVGRTFQIAATFASMTVLQNVQTALASCARQTTSLFRRADDLHRAEAMDLLRQVNMADQAERPCGVLAYGDVKRVELALALANKPKLLLMDEPTAGMAPAERIALITQTRDIAKHRNVGVLFTEHSMDVVFGFADRIMVLSRGRLIAEGDAEEIRNNPKVRQIYFGAGAEPVR